MLATPAEASERTELADPLTELLRSPVPEGSEIEAALEALKEAYETRDRATAMAGLATLERTIPAVADWVPLFEAEILAKSGDAGGVQEALSRLPAGSGILERWGGASLMQALEVMTGPVPPPLVDAVEELARLAPEREEEADVLGRLATRIQSGEPGRARSLRIQLLSLAPGSRGALSAARALAPGLEVDGSPELMDRVALELERHDRWSASLPLRRALLAVEPGPDRLLELARAQAESGDGTGALRTLDRGAARTPSWEAVRATALFAAGRDTEAMSTLRAVTAADPDHEGAARLLLARGLHEAERNASRGLELFQLLAASDHRPAEWDEPALALGLQLYESGRFMDAAAFLQAFAQGHPRTGPRQQALFWAGISVGRAGDMERRDHLLRAARAADPISYHGARVARLIGVPFLPGDFPAGPEGTDVSQEELANAVLRLRVHVGVPTRGSYLYEANRLSRYFETREGGLHALGEAMVTGGIPLHAARFVRMVAGDPGGNWDARLLRTAFPFPFEDQIRAASVEAGLDPFFVAGLIRQESLFQPSHPQPRRGHGAHADHAGHGTGTGTGDGAPWIPDGPAGGARDQHCHGDPVHRPAAPAVRRPGGGRPGGLQRRGVQGGPLAGAPRVFRSGTLGGEDPLRRDPWLREGHHPELVHLHFALRMRAGGTGVLPPPGDRPAPGRKGCRQRRRVPAIGPFRPDQDSGLDRRPSHGYLCGLRSRPPGGGDRIISSGPDALHRAPGTGGSKE
jgi:tetratricopeptide (TPR) repeat protein